MELELQKRLVERAQKGDRHAFERLYRAFASELLVRVIRPRVASPADADDVFVETFVTAMTRLETFTWRGKSLFHWLARIASNVAVDLSRRRQRERRLQLAVQEEVVVIEPAERPGEALMASANRAERHERIKRTLAMINPRYAKALTLRSLQGRERPECAEAMGVKLGTFDVLFLRAVRAFRRVWVQEFGEETL